MATTIRRVNPYVGLANMTVELLDQVGAQKSGSPTLDELNELMANFLLLKDASSDISELSLTVRSFGKTATVLNSAQDSVLFGENSDLAQELVNFPPLSTSALVNQFLTDLERKAFILAEESNYNDESMYLLCSIQIGITLSTYWQAQITLGGASDWDTEVAGGFDYNWVKDGIRGIMVKGKDRDNAQLVCAGAGFSMLRVLNLL